jgi:protein O-mannosyl-transferase
LAGLLFFAGTLFPVLGFCNVYPFIFSYVADHFQYLASLGIITLAAAGAALLLKRWRLWDRPDGYAMCLVPLAILAGLTWQQSRMYSDVETLYRTTIAENPDCWMARNNLGYLLADRKQFDEALAQYQKALELKPDYADAHNNLGHALVELGRLDEAVAHFQKALEISPNFTEAHKSLGAILTSRGQFDEAIAHFQASLKVNPDDDVPYNNLAIISVSRGKLDDAVAQYEKALGINPKNAAIHNNFACALRDRGRAAEAVIHLHRALEIDPDYAQAHDNLGSLLLRLGKTDEAIAQWDTVIRLQPENASALNQLAWLLATDPEGSVRNGARAVALAQRAAKLRGNEEPAILGTLAAAYAEAGRFSEAVEAAQQALALASSQNNAPLADALRARIKLYQGNSPYHEPRQPSPTPSGRP